MSLLTEAADAYRQQRQAAQLVSDRDLAKMLQRAQRRADNGSDLARVRVKALLDEFTLRGLEP